MTTIEKYRRLLNLAQAGIYYQKDVYDLERYEEIKKISLELIAELTQTKISQLEKLVSFEDGYQTPKIDVRALIKKDDNILLVEDAFTKEWALPGGFADVGLSPLENIIKEVKEETNLDVTSAELVAIFDTNKRPDIFQFFQYYKLVFECTVTENEPFKQNSETSAIGYFNLSELPKLSENRTTKEQLERLVSRDNTIICD